MIELPAKCGPEEFNALLGERTDERFEEVAKGEIWICRTCSTPAKQTTAYISVHEAIFDDSCAGFGEVQRIAVPYCPQCDGEDVGSMRSCVHIGMIPKQGVRSGRSSGRPATSAEPRPRRTLLGSILSLVRRRR